MGSDNLEGNSQEIVGTKTDTETIKGFMIGFIGGSLILTAILLLFFRRKSQGS
jgi:LPXTG-motif cell wall-anchored protein